MMEQHFACSNHMKQETILFWKKDCAVKAAEITNRKDDPALITFIHLSIVL